MDRIDIFRFNSAKSKGKGHVSSHMHLQKSGSQMLKTVGLHVVMCTYLWVSETLDTLWTLPTTWKVFIYQAFALNLQT